MASPRRASARTAKRAGWSRRGSPPCSAPAWESTRRPSRSGSRTRSSPPKRSTRATTRPSWCCAGPSRVSADPNRCPSTNQPCLDPAPGGYKCGWSKPRSPLYQRRARWSSPGPVVCLRSERPAELGAEPLADAPLDLDRALEREELEVHYQPIVELAGGRIVAVEALVRWRHPSRGLVLPSEFVPRAERTGQVLKLGRWVLGAACRQAAEWH